MDDAEASACAQVGIAAASATGQPRSDTHRGDSQQVTEDSQTDTSQDRLPAGTGSRGLTAPIDSDVRAPFVWRDSCVFIDG
ncbi:hypothetical protein [Micromonospora avicenniae]|uniref:hypothetical protein n=1 Tax=Micromonospora avicenniae TaxID=1198245 RepID=UPI000970741A|nr:hypothetical protein [Micromonospora avicenniae]